MKDGVLPRQKTLAENAGTAYPLASQDARDKHSRITTLLDRYALRQVSLLQLLQGLASNLKY